MFSLIFTSQASLLNNTNLYTSPVLELIASEFGIKGIKFKNLVQHFSVESMFDRSIIVFSP